MEQTPGDLVLAQGRGYMRSYRCQSQHLFLHHKLFKSFIDTKHVCFLSTCCGSPGDYSNEQSKEPLVDFSSSHSFTNYICYRQSFIIINLKPLLAQKDLCVVSNTPLKYRTAIHHSSP